MPVYEYECQKCGKVSSFTEKMFHIEPLFFGRKKCPACKSKKLKRLMSSFSAHPKASYTDQLNELKSMGNVQFTPPPPKPPWGDGPPPGGCPYEKEAKAPKNEPKRDSPIIVKSS